MQKYKNDGAYDTNKTAAESRCPLSCLSHDMLLSRARSLASRLQLERTKKSYWYQSNIRTKEEHKYNMPQHFSENFTVDHLKGMIMESTKLGELSDKSVLYYILHDVLKSFQHKPTGMRFSQGVIKWCISLANKIH